ncbi:MAG: YgaP family membrane protein [Ignavibacteriaceae bacterium]
MKKNVGDVDRWFRVVLGIVIAVLGIVYQSWWGLIAIVPLGTAFMRVCPAYTLFGISTLKSKEDKA